MKRLRKHLLHDPKAASYNLNGTMETLYDAVSMVEQEATHIIWHNPTAIVAFGIIALMTSILVYCASIWQTSKLFSNGLWSKKFFKSGGCWLLLAGGCGVLFGICLGLLIYPYSAIYLAGGFMLIGVSMIYVGRRGAIIGGLGGMQVGMTFGGLHSNSISAIFIEGVLCTFAGVAIGFIPIFPNLKINMRYIQHGLRSKNTSPNGNGV